MGTNSVLSIVNAVLSALSGTAVVAPQVRLAVELIQLGVDVVTKIISGNEGKNIQDMTNEEMADAILRHKRKSVDELIQEGIDAADKST